MSAASTPSVSSGQTLYYDTVVMHFSHPTNDATGEGSSAANQPHHAEQTGSAPKRAEDEVRQKTPSLRSLPTEPDDQNKQGAGMKTDYGRNGNALARQASVRTTASTHTTSAFGNGAPLTGPNAEPNVDQSLVERGANAERSLSQKQKDRITKEERAFFQSKPTHSADIGATEKESKKFSKLLKTESTTEKVALDSALKTLSCLQSLHKTAIKREGKAEVSYAKALSAAQDAEGRFHEERGRATEMRARAEARCIQERARWEGKEGEVRAQQERLDSARETVKETELRIAECAREVERLRIVKATDEVCQ